MVLRSFVVVCMSLCISIGIQADELDVYILTGQSNSLGTTNLEGDDFAPGTHPADSQTRFFWSNPSSIGSANPDTIVLLGDSGGAIKTLQMQQGARANPKSWGPEIGMARTMFDAGKSNVMVIKVSRGGGGNRFWLPKTGHMANHLMKQIDVALTEATKAGHTFKVKGFMYLQGESNSSQEAQLANTRLQTLIDAVQSHINSSYANAASNMYTVVGEIAASTSNTSRIKTTDLQKKHAAGSPDIGFIKTHDLPLKKDRLHFGKTSKLEIGRRFADAFLSRNWVENPSRIAGYSANAGKPEAVPHPLVQGLTESGKTIDVMMEATNDNNTPAWRIADNSPIVNPEYRQSLTAAEFKTMFDQGWIFKVRSKVVSGGGLALWSINKEHDPGWNIMGDRHMNGFQLKRVNNDELEVGLWQAKSPINLGPGSANQYHTFELRGMAGSSLFDFYIDDQLRQNKIDLRTGSGIARFDNALFFNSGSGVGTDLEVLWNEVSLTTHMAQ